MKSRYKKTTWIDSKTPVNAANLNKIENAIEELSKTSVDIDDLKNGDGINVESDNCGNHKISVDSSVMRSISCTGLEIVTKIPDDYIKDRLYFIIDETTLQLRRIYINGLTIFKSVQSKPITFNK